jgi:hypothetical protein
MGEAYKPRSGCPINASIEVFGDRWSLLVLRDIVFGDRYFRSALTGGRPVRAAHLGSRRSCLPGVSVPW